MRIRSVVCTVAAAVLSLPGLVTAQMQVTPVLSGLSSPLFVGHAGDGSNRLFILEKGGVMRVAQPGASTSAVFLNISGKIATSGEQGLLGLAFHPQYATNGRFFVFYTRTGDGALVIAEYRVSSGNSNVADADSEQVLLTIPHAAATNHNGGMLAFGPDGYLYISTGDGGGANDVPNNAQDVNSLLGKILRIDVSTPGAYVSPSSNPFYGATAGLDEIFALGIRNPWRFSFDRTTGQQWVGDVGQGQREEVNTSIVKGGNYGWRFYEGTLCNANVPSNPCNPAGTIFPAFEYSHSGGRCTVIGGYVYRGTQGTLPAGTYVYGDYCTGEIFVWSANTQTVLLGTSMNISSFGEDEAGEIYVVNLGGTVGRLTNLACSYAISPTSQNVGASSTTGTVTVTAGTGCGWTATPNASWLHVTSGSSGTGNGSVGYSVDTNTSSSSRNGTISIAVHSFTVNQSGAAACTFAISPASASYPPAGGNGSVAVAAGSGCSWTAVSSVSWITVTGTGGGTGNGTATYSVAPYTGKGPRNRSGSITIAGKTFRVKQTR